MPRPGLARPRFAVIAAALALSCPALAHEGETHADRLSAAAVWDALTFLTLLVIVVAYLRGYAVLRTTTGGRASAQRWHIAAFLSGCAAVAVALLSPLDRWSDVLFSAHMAQHEILMLIAAPLMVAGRPFSTTLWSVPSPARTRIGDAVRMRWVQSTWTRLTGPLTVLVLHAAVLWVWHVPRLFEAALHSETVHVVQHLGFFLTAALFWWSLIHGRYGRAGYGIGVAYVFATAMHTQILGALLTFAPRSWYPTHAARTGASALQDQQLAGVVMWIPFGVVFLVVGLALFAAWLGEAERRVAFTRSEELAQMGARNHP